MIVVWTCHYYNCNNNNLVTGKESESLCVACDDILYQINKASRGVSGNYWINTTTGVHQVYCDMELECGGHVHKGGWMRIADLDTSRGDDCPSGWTKITAPVAYITPGNNAGC